MGKRIVLAGLAAGLVLFVWEAVAHMALPLGEAGIRGLDAAEAPIMAAVKANIREDGFYYFPNPMAAGNSPEQQKAAEAKMLAGPTGMLVVHPNGDPGISPMRLGLEFTFDVLSMIVAGIVLSQAVMLKSLGNRVGLVTLLACLPTLRTELPQWNWYGFPTAFTAAQFTLHLVGFALGGLVLAKMVRAKE